MEVLEPEDIPTEKGSSADGSESRMEEVEERICDLGDRAIETT